MLRIPDDIIASIEGIHLPTIPGTVLRFMQMVTEERSSAAELAAFAGRDPALSATILTFANSCSLRGRGGSTDLAYCLASIGTDLVGVLAATLAVQNVHSALYCSQEFNFSGFLGHSLRVAEVARALAIKRGYPDVEGAGLAGLLHNVGQLLLLGGLKERYALLLAASSDELALRDRERTELGTCHAAVGAWQIDQWQLSSFMADAILFHESATEEIVAADTLSQIVWSAHKICHHYAETDPLQHEQDVDYATMYSMLGVDATTVFTLYHSSSLRVARLAADSQLSEYSAARTFPYPTLIPCENAHPSATIKDGALLQAAEMVHDLALLQLVQQLFTPLQSEAELLFSIGETARMLFGLGAPSFLMLQPEEAVLSGAAISCQPVLLQQIKIPLDPERSLAAGVALEKMTAATTFEQQKRGGISLADLQITRILGSDGLLYIPLKGRSRILGIMAYGVTAVHSDRINSSLPLMTRFAAMSAICLETLRELQEREQSLAVDVNTLIEALAALHGDSLFTSRGIRIGKNLDPALSAAVCDRHRIRQILHHLWKNASQATAGGGCFVISTHDNINQDGRPYIEIRLSDTGCGIPPKVMEQLFRSPAPDSSCFGQCGSGLTRVAALVREIDGRITCQSKIGQGTRFSILIPKTGNTQ